MLVQPSLLSDTKPLVHSAGQVHKPDHFAILKRLIAEANNPVAAEPEKTKLDYEGMKRTGGCERPIQLSGSFLTVEGTGEIRESHTNTYVNCKTRRATKCEPCSLIYQHDARHLITAGLKGGKGISPDVAQRPALFVTFTAPSFGAVHSANGHTCLPRRNAETCEHGRLIVCWKQHEKDDMYVGQPICPDCYDYRAAVLWNNAVGNLWRITRINLDRSLARALQSRIHAKTGNKIPQAKLKKNFSTQYIKVAEFQRRGMVHFHLALRLDGKRRGRPAPFSVEELTDITRQVVEGASVEAVDGNRVTWGQQLDIDELPADDSDEHEQPSRAKTARYLAKYATKGSDVEGKLDRKFNKEEELNFLSVNNHLARLVRTSWKLARTYEDAKLDAWSHQLGYRGHFLTKSRGWSTTFKALRQVRIDHQEAIRQASWDAMNPEARQVVIAKWQFAGTGFRTGTDDAIAEAVRNKPRTNRAA